MTTNRFDLRGKVAIVTGGNGGIGLGLAHGLADAGADIAVIGRNEAKSAAAVADLKARGVKAKLTVQSFGDTRPLDRRHQARVRAGIDHGRRGRQATPQPRRLSRDGDEHRPGACRAFARWTLKKKLWVVMSTKLSGLIAIGQGAVRHWHPGRRRTMAAFRLIT